MHGGGDVTTKKDQDQSVAPSPFCAATSCRKKVSILGFLCKCGKTYCEKHRLPEDHSPCSHDWSAEGRCKITKENPVIVAAKVLKF
jgi:predicted nucleic acid binding AN1-type Zn finger protein